MKKLFLFLGAFALLGAGCATGGSSLGVSPSDVAPFEAPGDWGTSYMIDQGFTYRYPTIYTTDLATVNEDGSYTYSLIDRETSETVLTIEIGEDNVPYFTQVDKEDPYFEQIVGSVQFD